MAVAPVRGDSFCIVHGQAFTKEYRATPGKARVFCAECASPLYSTRDDQPDVMRLRIGTLDSPVQARTRYHAFVADKANWYDIEDDWPQHPGLPC